MIPKKIWQTHRYENQQSLPLYMQGPSLSWSVENPDFEYTYVPNSSFESFISTNFDKEWLNIFKLSDSQITKSDIWRLLLLYRYGGIYADVDTVCIKPIASFINMEADFVIESSVFNGVCVDPEAKIVDKNGYERIITNSVFATKPGGFFISLLLEQVKESCLQSIKNGKRNVGFRLTGPPKIAEIYGQNPKSLDLVEFFNVDEIIELSGSAVWNDFKRKDPPFLFSDLSENYGELSLNTQNEIKFFNKSGHGGFIYDY